ncbi:MAG: acetyl-CoA acetyltransferase [Chlamydia sp. 32-24]|nr:MAG: acetyl-CoA acetyltransferase [Chlamydia sp. 32-24]
MRSDNNQVYVLSSARIPFAKSQTSYNDYTRKDLMQASFDALVEKAQLKGKVLGDVALGAVMNGISDWNLARECILSSELSPLTPGYNVQRACGTGLEAAWEIALKAFSGAIDIGIAGGVDTNSDLPIEVSPRFQRTLLNLNKAKSFAERLKIISLFSLRDLKPRIPSITEPKTLLSMGEHCELMVKEWKISRKEQDEFALQSHKNSAKAFKEGFFDDLVYPFAGVSKDTIIRDDTTLDKLGKLKPAFDLKNGTITAGNSSPLTDGAACVLIGNSKGAQEIKAVPLAKFIDIQVAAVDFVHGDGLLMAPTIAISRLLERNHLSIQDFDYYELHEAFAGQVLCNLKALESKEYCQRVLGRSEPIGTIDRNKLNVMGSSVSVGHPFAATGARILGTLAKLLSKEKGKRGLISICTAGGMGIAAILESVD